MERRDYIITTLLSQRKAALDEIVELKVLLAIQEELIDKLKSIDHGIPTTNIVLQGTKKGELSG
jgi:hypothetical protein